MTTPYSVDQLCTYTFGGAATAARRLHEGLRNSDIESRFWHRDESECYVDDPSYQPLTFRPFHPNPIAAPVVKKIKRMRRKRARADYRDHLAERPEGFEVVSPPTLFEDTHPEKGLLQGDILHLHWIAFFVDFSSFFASIPTRKPIVWTLHDMNPFTGGCHYVSGCDRFTSGCGHCPQVSNGCTDDVSKRSYALKRKLFKNRRLTVVTPSRWLGREAQRSLVFPGRTRFEVIPYGLETDIYRPIDKRMARHELGIRDDELVISFGAEDLKNHRKGMKYLWEAIDQIDTHRPVSGLLFGSGEPETTPAKLKTIHSMGYVDDAEQKAKIYSAADVFVMPSLEDNQPQTGLEAMACGTPVVGFDIGGVPDYVRSGLTGMLAKDRDSDDLARQISWILQHDQARSDMGAKARQMIEGEFPLHLQAQRYQQLYEEILGIESQQPQHRRAA